MSRKQTSKCTKTLRFELNSPTKVIHLLRENYNWKKARNTYGQSNQSARNNLISNDDFAKHLLEIHKSHCSECSINPNTCVVSKQQNKHQEENDDSKSVQQMLLDLNQTIQRRLHQIENRFKKLNSSYENIRSKVDRLSNLIQNHSSLENEPSSENGENTTSESNLTIVRLNKESDFPDGSWLGDSNKPLERVRCCITPKDLFHINSTCNTVEKMALTLLDYLFDREIQAESNISGQGRHCKKQLNPLFIYGIQCHLKQRFGLDVETWNKIKLNIDSKCRSAYRRKVKGLPLNIAKVSNTLLVTSDSEQSQFDLVSKNDFATSSSFTEEITMNEDSFLAENDGESQVNKTDIQIVDETPEPEALAQLEYEIVTEEHLLNESEK